MRTVCPTAPRCGKRCSATVAPRTQTFVADFTSESLKKVPSEQFQERMNGQSGLTPEIDVPQFRSPATTCAEVRMFGVTYATAGHSALMASASSVVSVELPVKIFAPLCELAPGKIMMKFEPRELIVSWIDFEAPFPFATTTMTQPTPMTMPSIVRNDRILFR